MLNFMYRIKVKECLDELEKLRKEKEYEEFVRKTNEQVKKWNRIIRSC